MLLLDEPLGALDKNLREQMQLEIKRIQREIGITMIYVTHDQTEAMTMSDRVAVFHRAASSRSAAAGDLPPAGDSRFVGEFIGDSNFLAGRTRPGAARIGRAVGARSRAGGAEGYGCAGRRRRRMIRPERLRWCRAAAPDDGHNLLDMTVDEIINYGDFILVIGTTKGLTLRARLVGNDAETLQIRVW